MARGHTKHQREIPEENPGQNPPDPNDTGPDNEPQLTEAQVLQGGPQPPQSPQEPEFEEIEIGGVKARVSPADAEAVRQTLEALKRPAPQEPPRQPVQQPRQSVQTEDPDAEFYAALDQQLFTSPADVFKNYGTRLRQQIKQEMTQEYRQEQARQQFWDSFYGAPENKGFDRKKDHDLVQTLLMSNLDQLGQLPADQAAQELSKIARSRLLGRMENKEPGSQRTVTEGANNPGIQRTQSADPGSNISSLSSALRQRREARRAGRAA